MTEDNIIMITKQNKLNKSVPQIRITEYDTAYIVSTYGDMMYKLAVAQLNNRSDAYDVVQDVLLKIHIKSPAWDSPEHVKAWLLRTVINRCRDYNRNPFNVKTIKLEEEYEAPQDNDEYKLQEALANLPEKYRLTLYLHYYEGYKIKEIAEILKVSESGIKKRLVKGRGMIEQYLTD